MDASCVIESLRASELISAEQLADVVQRLSSEDPFSVLRNLVETDVLTHYQANRVWFGRAEELVLGQYRIVDHIGEGGTGQVFKARHVLMQRDVAIKFIIPRLLENERVRWMFRREVLAATELQHPNIVMAYDAGEFNGGVFLVMEYVDGPNLYDVVEDQGPLPISLTCELMRQAVLALQCAHKKGIVHRDIKPDNLLLPRITLERLTSNSDSQSSTPGDSESPEPLLKVADFGLARLMARSDLGTLVPEGSGKFIGTPTYVAPEQASNAHHADIRADLYSLGCTMYFVLAGQAPFPGDTLVQLIRQHAFETPKPISEIRSDIPSQLAALIHKLLEKDPSQRLQTPTDLLAELHNLTDPQTAQNEAKDLNLPPPQKDNLNIVEDLAPTKVISCLANWSGLVLTKETGQISPNNHRITESFRRRETLPRATLLAGAVPLFLPAIQTKTSSSSPASQSDHNRCARSEQSESPLAASHMIREESNGILTGETPPKPLSASSPSRSLDPLLKQYWQQWQNTIEALATRNNGLQLDDSRYHELYNHLVARCRAEAASAKGERKKVLERLQASIAPWVSAQTLTAADKITKQNLLQNCRELSFSLGLSTKQTPHWIWLILLLSAATGGLMGVWLLLANH